MQSVEPAARLIDSLANVVRWKVLFEFVFVFERVVPLRVGHRAGVKPAIDNLRNSLPGLAVFFERDFVNSRPMQIQFAEFAPG